ncbi:FAD/NAD(P)-binding protein [Vitiosangium sp. GDMCC 1.1324]|uniref:FAD/NAD(P)-binding protein n=1 Tax=Vitiosangium sp. (strain GDMCC 1.1324) TaxID=2138576 RepID=UPI000D3B5761|nr:NAD(P)/FAD-dependent oxidoreductase [Vitiosangium sp. GDMCC 1.1324]PTL81503.1 NAD(P)/FAD-dependent oxidoreductase [Vitiosangium sp. GDMCC 1.1324]
MHSLSPPSPVAKSGPGLAALEASLRKDLERLEYPKRSWVLPRRTREGSPILDVLIIGGGQSGLAAAFGLMREKVTNLLVVDDSPPGLAGPWKTFARMHTLRTPKHLTGPDHNLPNLGFQSWYEAQYGEPAWQQLGLIPKELWADYLDWYRRFLAIPVRCHTRAGAISWRAEDRCFAVPVQPTDGGGQPDTLLARKVVLATGIDGSGRWDAPSLVTRLPRELWAHTRDDIDFEALRGKRIGVLGAGASAFDNASVALERGAAEVHLFYRRKTLPTVNAYRWAEFVGFLKHHADLPDADRWRFIRRILEMGQLPPHDTYHRARAFPSFHLHGESPWQDVRAEAGTARVTTPHGTFTFDKLIIGSGTVTDLSLRPELANLVEDIALWKDRYTPPPAEAHSDLARHPYLGPGFEFQEKVPGRAPYLGSVFNYTFGCLLSLGFGGASISGMKYSLPKLVSGITRQLYCDDKDAYFESLMSYDVKEFEP